MLAQREIPRLAELRLQATEARLDADLHLGRHAEVIAELRRLTSEHPLREKLHVQLMLALYRDGRQADALAAYQAVREMLVGELGTEPGTELRELHRRILAHDTAIAAPARAGLLRTGETGTGGSQPRRPCRGSCPRRPGTSPGVRRS